ncbi:hypothetical protein [Coleofasciculus chthonoplastes]|uniref:hypothetical protein n=1 Tax=Coleofasciculus chthonoplastes TaxID=64178 RepID=UPI0032F2B1F0
MPEPTVPQVFGSNANQTDLILEIKKADLATVGLTPNANNTAESMFVALLLLNRQHLNTDNQANDSDIQITIQDGPESLVERNGTTYRQRLFYIYLDTPDSPATLDPNQF